METMTSNFTTNAPLIRNKGKIIRKHDMMRISNALSLLLRLGTFVLQSSMSLLQTSCHHRDREGSWNSWTSTEYLQHYKVFTVQYINLNIYAALSLGDKTLYTPVRKSSESLGLLWTALPFTGLFCGHFRITLGSCTSARLPFVSRVFCFCV